MDERTRSHGSTRQAERDDERAQPAAGAVPTREDSSAAEKALESLEVDGSLRPVGGHGPGMTGLGADREGEGRFP